MWAGVCEIGEFDFWSREEDKLVRLRVSKMLVDNAKIVSARAADGRDAQDVPSTFLA